MNAPRPWALPGLTGTGRITFPRMNHDYVILAISGLITTSATAANRYIALVTPKGSIDAYRISTTAALAANFTAVDWTFVPAGHSTSATNICLVGGLPARGYYVVANDTPQILITNGQNGDTLTNITALIAEMPPAQ